MVIAAHRYASLFKIEHRSAQTSLIAGWGEKVPTLYICFLFLAHIIPNLPQRAHEWSLLHTGTRVCSRSNTGPHKPPSLRVGGKRCPRSTYASFSLPTSSPTYHSVPMNGHCCTPVRESVQDRTQVRTNLPHCGLGGKGAHALHMLPFPCPHHPQPTTACP